MQGRPYSNVSIEFDEGITVTDLITDMGISLHDIEAVFVNGSVRPFDTLLRDGDRVALVPPGVPGPYRVLLGMKKSRRLKPDRPFTMERKIQLRLFASLRRFSPADSENFAVSHGESIESVLQRLDIPQDQVSLVIIDGVRKDITSRLEGGERVGIFPLIGGG